MNTLEIPMTNLVEPFPDVPQQYRATRRSGFLGGPVSKPWGDHFIDQLDPPRSTHQAVGRIRTQRTSDLCELARSVGTASTYPVRVEERQRGGNLGFEVLDCVLVVFVRIVRSGLAMRDEKYPIGWSRKRTADHGKNSLISNICQLESL